MKISDFLLPANVTADAAYSDRQRVLEALAQKAGPIVDVLADRILADLLKREQLGSTGVGGGVAIPHARYHQIEKPFGMLLRLRKPIDFDAVDGNPVDTVFLLLLPGSHRMVFQKTLPWLQRYSQKLPQSVKTIHNQLKRRSPGLS